MIDETAREALEDAKIDMLINYPFFGMVISNLALVETKSRPTLATDYKRIFYNPKFIRGLNRDKRVFALAHEVMHNIEGHDLRRNGRDPDWWNMAADYEINYLLVHEKIVLNNGQILTGVGEIDHDWLYQKRFGGMTAEEIYDILEEEDAPKLKAMDDHLEPDEEKDSSDEEDDGETMGEEVEDIPPYTRAEAEKAQRDFFLNMTSAESSHAGSCPAKVRRLIREFNNPKIDWRSFLRSEIKSLYKPQKTWNNPHRRSWQQGFVMPGMEESTSLDVAIAIDLSGSISTEQGTDLFSETAGVLTQFKSYHIWLWTFDAIVYEKTMLEFTERDNIDLARDFIPKGGGGTDFGNNWKFMKKNNIRPKKFIVFTDGYCSFEGCDPNYVDTIWLVHSNKNFNPPFGVTVEYEAEKR